MAAPDEENAGYVTQEEQHEPVQVEYYQDGPTLAPVFPSYMSLTGPRDQVCNPCCCCSLRWGSIIVGALIFLFGIYGIVDAINGPPNFGTDDETHTALSNQLKRNQEFMWTNLFGPLFGIMLPGLLLIIAAAKLIKVVALIAAIWLGFGTALMLVGVVVLAEAVGKVHPNINSTDAQKMNYEREKGMLIVLIWIGGCCYVSFGLYATICAVELYRQIRNGEYKKPRLNTVMASY